MEVLEFADHSEFFGSDRCSVQYPVIYDIFSRFFVVIASAVIVLVCLTVTLTEERKSEDRQFARFSDLPLWYFSDALQHI